MNGPSNQLYLDYNATTPPHPAVIERVKEALAVTWANPSSAHMPGLEARELLQEAREQVAGVVGVDSSQVFFTSGGTEANALALWSAWRNRKGKRDRIIVSQIEHASVLEGAKALTREGARLELAPVDSTGRLDMEAFSGLLTDTTAVVAVMLANNEIGTVQPVTEAARLSREKGAYFMCDAVQAIGKIPVSFKELGVDYLAMSAHKIYGPKGIGCLCARHNVQLSCLIPGGGQERGIRSGTENVPGIAGFGEASRQVPGCLRDFKPVASVRDNMERQLEQQAGAVKLGESGNRLPNTAGLAFEGVDGRALLTRLSARGVHVSTGSACHSQERGASSHVLQAMGVPGERAAGFIRISLGRRTTPGEADEAVSVLAEEVHKVRG